MRTSRCLFRNGHRDSLIPVSGRGVANSVVTSWGTTSNAINSRGRERGQAISVAQRLGFCRKPGASSTKARARISLIGPLRGATSRAADAARRKVSFPLRAVAPARRGDAVLVGCPTRMRRSRFVCFRKHARPRVTARGCHSVRRVFTRGYFGGACLPTDNFSLSASTLFSQSESCKPSSNADGWGRPAVLKAVFVNFRQVALVEAFFLALHYT